MIDFITPLLTNGLGGIWGYVIAGAGILVTALGALWKARQGGINKERQKQTQATLDGIDRGQRAAAEADDALATGMTPAEVKKRNDDAWRRK